MTKKIPTLINHYAENRENFNGAVVPPIYQTSLFTFNSYEEADKAFSDPYEHSIYTRGKNPTVRILEDKIAKLADGEKCKFFASGMAAISSAILHYLEYGDHVITINNIYGPANNFLNQYLKNKMNIETSFVEGTKISDFKKEIKDNTKLIYLESPSSAVFKLQNLSKIADLASKHNIKTIVDNSYATFLNQKPLNMGINLEVHSASKYISGHSDVVAGCIIGSEKDIREIYNNEHAFLGGKISPNDAWLILRGLRTMPMRMEKHQSNAIKIARFLDEHEKIKKVNYVGMENFPQKELAQKQMTGFSGLMSFEMDTDIEGVKRFLNSLEIFSIGVSWGGHESLAFAPIIAILKEMPEEQAKNMGISPGVIRISIGFEDHKDLIYDLNNALEML